MTTCKPVRVAIANDYALIVSGLAWLLARHPTRIQVIESVIGEPVLSNVDVVLYDSFGSTVDFVSFMRSATSKVAIYSWTQDPDVVAKRLFQGASGYLSKRLTEEELLTAIEAIRDGHIVTMLGHPITRDVPASAWPGQETGLSAREAEVLALITQGLSNQQIANQLFLSINSVKTYIRTGYRKIDVQSRSQAVRWGITNGFDAHRARSVATT